MNTQTLEDRMMLMKPHELQQFAAMHKNDPYVLPLAMKISDMRRKLKVAEGMQYAGQKQPTVADQAVASMAPQEVAPQQQLPEQTGIAPLQAPNIQGMADGGIAGYAAGPTERRGIVDTAAYREYAIKKAQAMGLNPRFVDSLFRVESSTKNHPEGYDPYAKSKTGPVGIGQLTKATAQAYGLKPSDRYDPYKNMDAALAHLSDLTKKYQGDERKVAVAYNQGEGYLNNHLRQNKGKLVPEALDKAEPRKYLQRIQELSSGKQPNLAQKAIEAIIPPAQAEVVAPPSVNKAGIQQIPTNIAQAPATAPRPQAAPVDDYVDPMGGIASVSQAAPQAQSGTKKPVASTIASLLDVIPNAFTGTAGEITRAISRPFLSSDEADKQVRGAAATFADPAARILGVRDDPAYRQGPVGAALSKVSEGVETVGGNVADITGANQSDVTNAINLAPFLPKVAKNVKTGKYGVDYNLPTKAGAVKPADAGLAMLAERSKQASAEAAATRAKTAPRADTQQMPLAAEPVPQQMSLPGMEPRVPVQGELFPETVPQPKPLKPGEFPIHPDTLAMQERAAQVRAEQAKGTAAAAEVRAKEAAAAEAKYRAELENKPPSVKDKLLNAADKVPVQKTLGAAQQGQNRPAEKRPYEAFEQNFVGTDAKLLPAPEDLSKKEKKEVVADVKASPEGKEIKKSGLDLTDKDWLNMGLNLLSSKSEGQQGLQGFLSNVGTAGTATLAQKQEREKIEAAKAFQDIQGRYYETIAKNIGTPQGEERIIQRYQTDPDFAAAYDRMQGSKNDRLNVAALTKVFEEAKMLNPKYKDLTLAQWMQMNGIGQPQTAELTAAGQDAFTRNRTQIGG